MRYELNAPLQGVDWFVSDASWARIRPQNRRQDNDSAWQRTRYCPPRFFLAQARTKGVHFSGSRLDCGAMFAPVATKDPTAVEVEVQSAYLQMFPGGDRLFVPRVFGWVIESFLGNYADYQAIDARYHDLEHTMQGTLCMARLLRGRHAAGAEPVLSQRMFELGLLAILLHDTGYLKRRGDTKGTGAKYTITHVTRSAEFASRILKEKGLKDSEIKSVQNMIRCTGVDAALDMIPFGSDEERVVGFALGTADLLGQMAAEDYVEKLPVLFSEFAEAAEYSHDQASLVAMFSSAEDLMRKTPMFWENYVKPKLDDEFLMLHEFLRDPHPNGENEYEDRIEENMERLRGRLATASR